MISYRVSTRRQYQAGRISLTRRLSGPGKILVQPGQHVMPADEIGQVTISSNLVVVDVAAALGLHHQTANGPVNIRPHLLKAVGDHFEKGDVLAEHTGRLTILKKTCYAPVTGQLIALEGDWLLLAADAKTTSLNALISGVVTKITPTQSAVIETQGCYIDATLGLGGECYGQLYAISDDVQTDINSDMVEQIQQPSVLMAGGTILPEALAALPGSAVVGIIVGSINTSILAEPFQPPVPIIATEGVGSTPMFIDTWQMLHHCHQAVVSLVAPVTMQQMRQSSRASIMVPQPGVKAGEQPLPSVSVAAIGDRVRNVREPNVMTWGRLAVMQDQPQPTLAKIPYLGADVLLADEMQFVSWFNLEKIG